MFKTTNATHLAEVNQSYYYHAKDALQIFFEAQVVSIKMIIHAIFPDIFKTACSDFCKTCLQKVENKKK